MGVQRGAQDLDNSFCTETEILEEAGAACEEQEEVSMPLDLINRTESSDDEEGDVVDDFAQPASGLRGCIRSRPCAVCLYLILVLLLLSSFMSVIVVAVLVAVPYHQASKYVATQCTPVHSSLDRALRKCSCGKGCTSRYPCLTITVSYRRGEEEVIESLLADDESLIDRQCSYYPPCLTAKERNIKAVRLYENQFGTIGQPYNCLYDPTNPHVVVRVRRFKISHVIHGLAWSVVLFFSSLALLTFALRFKGCSVL